MAARPPPQGRGRAGRGRAPASTPAQAPPLAAPPPAASAWGKPLGQPPQRPQAKLQPAGVPQAMPPRPPSQWPRPQADVAGLAKKMSDAAIAGSSGGANGNGHGNGNGNGDGDKRLGRGGMRGRRTLDEALVATRPPSAITKCGKMGAPKKFVANYFEMRRKAEWLIHQYRVDFTAEEDRINVKRAWLNQHKAQLTAGFIFDGTMIFTPRILCRQDQPLTLTSQTKEGAPVVITIKWVKQIDKGDPTHIQIYGLILRRCMGKLDLTLVGRNLYDPSKEAKTEIREHNLTVWPGYLTAIRQCEMSLLLNCEISHKVMRTDTAYALLHETMRKGGDFQSAYVQAIIGQVVMTPYNNKTYRVDDVEFNKSPMSTFTIPKTGRVISIREYYLERYESDIKDVRQPLLVSKLKDKDIRGGKKEPVLLVPELCQMTGMTDRMRENFNLMKALALVTHVPPTPRVNKLLTFNTRLLNQPEVRAELDGWEMQLSKTLVEVPGRMLPPSMIKLGGVDVPAGHDADWTRSSSDKAMYLNVAVQSWLVIVTQNLRGDGESFISKVIAKAHRMKFMLPPPIWSIIGRDNPVDISRAVDQAIATNEPDMIVFLVSNNNADRYSAIKKKCYIDRALNSQVVCKRNLTCRNVDVVAAKVAIQINTKLGGAPWTLALPNTGAMIVGFDVCHDTLNKSKSVGALVATSNVTMTKWFSNATIHANGEELSDSMGVTVRLACIAWMKVTGALPARIILYRDGVGDGQIAQVHGHEVKAIMASLAQLYGDGPPPKLTNIIVTKRINTRIFLPTGPGSFSNPMPGSIVDDVITQPEKYDFFLISQNAKQGTVMPTAYNIIHDDSGWDPDRLQRLTYMTTHLYYNLSSTVRVPAPVQYAHKLAFLVSQSLHCQPNPTLGDRLYFI